MADDIKRLNYFTGQFLEAGDFSDEQRYHIDMRRRLTASLRGTGILDGGFKVAVKTQATATEPAIITVGAGFGVDNNGRELVILTLLEKEIPKSDLTTFSNKTIAVYLVYNEEQSDNKSGDDTSGSTRWTEKPDIILQLATASAPTDSIRLENIIVDSAGNISLSDEPVRQLASLLVNGKVGIGIQNPGRALDIAGSMRSSGEIQTTSANAFRMICGDYSAFFRNDGSDTWLLVTNKGDQSGGWNDLRPLRINNASGAVTLGNLDVADNFTATIRCADFCMGHSSRRKTPGRALSDVTNSLFINWETDWANVSINGKVGIGTPTPEQMLSVQSGLNVDQANANAGTLQPGISFGSGSGEGIASRRSVGSNQYGLDFYTGGAVRLSMTNDGNVGIGTSSPTAKLEVVGGGAGTIDFKVNGRLQSNNNDGGLWVAGDRFIGGHSGNKVGFFNGGAWQLTVQNDGKVGIGTPTPEQMLSVQSGLNVDQANANAGTLQPGISFGSKSGEGIASRRSAGGNQYGLDFYAGGAVRLSVSNAGNVGIGTSSPTAKLEVVGGGAGTIDFKVNGRLQSNNNDGGLWVAGDRFIGGHSGNKVGFFNGGAWQLTVQNDGKVGIGTLTPEQMLSVQSGLNVDQANTNAGTLQPGISFGSGSGEGIASRRSAGGNQYGLDFYTGGAVRLSMTNDGNVDIGSNPVRFSSGWTSSPDAVLNRAEISNDTGTYKTLMIIGNKSAGLGRRVSVWDRLEVNGIMQCSGEIQTTSANAFRMIYGDYGSFFRNDGSDTYLLLTNKGNQTGGWNDLRPLRINNASGTVYLGTVNISGNGTIGSSLSIGQTINIQGKDAFILADDRLHINGGANTFPKGVRIGGGILTDNINIGGAQGAVNPGQGNIIISGNIGNHGYSPTPRNPGWLGGIHTWDIEAEGSIWCAATINGKKMDLAENYFSDIALEAGDVVSFDPSEDRIVLSRKTAERFVCGVISTAPGFVLNSDPAGQSGKWYPVALAGRVPCKVTDENGAIRRGDLLTSSSSPGYAMKAKPIVVNGEVIFPAGTIIGKSLSNFESGQGIIDIFICLR